MPGRRPGSSAILVCAAVALFVCCTPVCAQDAVRTLEAAGAAIGVDAGSGDVASLRIGGRELLAAPAPMFMAQVTDPADLTSRWFDSRAAEGVEVVAGDGRLTVSYTHVGDSIEAAAEWRAEEECLVGSVIFSNTSGLVLERVYFPHFLLATPIGDDPADDRLFFPGGDGFVARYEGFADGRWLGRGYPGNASMQFMAYYDDAGGLALQCRDAEARPKTFVAQHQTDRGGVRFEVWHELPFVTDADFRSPPVLLARTGPSWMDAAASYRTWARKQWWAQPKAEEEASPQWLREGFLTLGGSLRPLGMGRHVVQPDEWPRLVRAWRDATGAPAVLLDLREWEHDGVYTSPFFFPVYPSPGALSAVWRSAKAEAARPMAMVAGLKWMIERDEFPGRAYHVTPFDERERFGNEGRPVCVVGRDGEVLIKEPFFNWDGRHALMCPAHAFTHRHFCDAARELARVGFTVFEFDQMNGGSCPPCYSTEHGHPPGPGLWVREEMAAFMSDVRRIGREMDPEFATSMEDPSEVLLPQLDMFIGRPDNLGEWPAAGPGTEVVPAFTFVYGPLVRSMAIDIQNSAGPHEFELLQTARAFIAGEAPSTNMAWWDMVWSYGEDDLLPLPGKMDARQLKLLASAVRTHCGPALPYMSYGEMLAAEPLDLPGRPWKQVAWKDGEKVEEDLMSPAVLRSAWELADGRRAFVFVNMADDVVSFAYGFRVSGRSPRSSAVPAVFIDGESSRTAWTADGENVSVPGLSTVVFEFGPGAWPEEAE